MTKPKSEEPTQFEREAFVHLIAQMAASGVAAKAELHEKLGMDPRPGHVIDAMLQLVSILETCAQAGDVKLGFEAASSALFLLRDLAISQGYFVPQEDVVA